MLTKGATKPDAWTRLVLTHPQYQPLPSLFPRQTMQAIPVLHQAAPVLALGSPEISLLTDSTMAGHRRLRLLLRPGRTGVSSLRLTMGKPTRLSQLRVAGHLLPLNQLTTSVLPSIDFVAQRASGEIIDIELATVTSLQLVVTTRSIGLPPVPGLPPLPATYIPQPGSSSFTTQVKRTFTF
jgi:hypothetical protein